MHIHISCKCDTSRAGHFTLDAHASRPVACLVQSVRLIYFSAEGVTMFTVFPRTRWPRRRFSESYAVRISVKISRICEFRVIVGIMTGLLGCCSSAPERAGRMITPNPRYARVLTASFPLAAPSGSGRTTPSQPGHYPLSISQVSSPTR